MNVLTPRIQGWILKNEIETNVKIAWNWIWSLSCCSAPSQRRWALSVCTQTQQEILAKWCYPRIFRMSDNNFSKFIYLLYLFFFQALFLNIMIKRRHRLIEISSNQTNLHTKTFLLATTSKGISTWHKETKCKNSNKDVSSSWSKNVCTYKKRRSQNGWIRFYKR